MKITVILHIVLLFFVQLATANDMAIFNQTGNIKPTADIHKAKVEKYLKRHIKRLSIHGDAALVKSDGNVYRSASIGNVSSGFTDEFALTKFGDYFTSDYGVRILTNRVSTDFWLLEVLPDSILVQYRVHECKNGKYSIDQGEIALKQKKS